MTSPTPKQRNTNPRELPNSMYLLVEADEKECFELASWAANKAKQDCPKLSGYAAKGIIPWWGKGFFGIQWEDDYLWYQERGTRGRTMKELAGKTIPMWLDDPTGSMRAENPKAKTRITQSGRTQVLIFRRAAKIGAQKYKKKKVAGRMTSVMVPASYPGAPGRIATRQRPNYPSDNDGGRIAKGNIGVKWYHPGITGRGFLHNAIRTAALEAGLGTPAIYAIRVRF